MSVVGSQDHLECLMQLPAGAAAQFAPIVGGPLCLGYRYTVEWAGVPYWVADHGYVVTNAVGVSYYPVDAALLGRLKTMEGMPAMVPSYAVPTKWKALAIGSWGVALLVVAVVVWQALQRRKVRKLRTHEGLSTTGPVATYMGDRKLVAAIAPLLTPTETVSHYALTYDEDMRGGSSVATAHKQITALTNERLLMVITKVGLFGLGAGTPKVVKIDRADIAAVTLVPDEPGALQVHLQSGSSFGLYVPLTMVGYSSSNQMSLARDLPLLFPTAAALPKATAHARP